MSGGYRDRLVARATGGPGLLRPRLPSLFEPVDPAGGPAGWAWQASPEASADPPPARPIPAPEWTGPAPPAEPGPDLAAVASVPAMVPDPAPGRGRRRLAPAGPADEPAPPAEAARPPDGPLVAGDSSGDLPGPVSGRPALAGPPAEPPATAPAEERSSGVMRPPVRPARAGSDRLRGAASDRDEATVAPVTTALPALPAPPALPTVPATAAAPRPGRHEARPGPVAEDRPSGPAWRPPPSPPPATGRAPSPPSAAGFETGGPAVPPILPTSPADGSAEPVIHVTIGRIEVRAVQAEQPPAPRRPSPPSGPSLERYLRERSKRRR